MEIQQGTFTPLVFITTGRMADECVKYHSRLAKLIANKKRESYSRTISWIRAKVSFDIVPAAILWLRGSRSRRRQLDFVDSDLQIENIRACPSFFFFWELFKELEGAIHSTKIPTGPTGKIGPPQKVEPFFRNFSGWTGPTHWVLDRNLQKLWLNGSRPEI